MSNQLDDHGQPDFNNYPIRVTLCFRTEEEKRNFMAELSDGAGESLCVLNWPWKNQQQNDNGRSFYEQPMFAVTQLKEEDDF